MNRADKVIRWSTAAVVVVLAGVAAVVSYRHILEVVTAHGEAGWVAYLVPLTIDGLLVAASLTLLDAARRGIRRYWLSWVALAVGILLTISANVLHGLAYGVIGAVTAALPAVTLTISFELLMGLIRRAAAPAVPQESPAPVETVEAVAVPVTSDDGSTALPREGDSAASIPLDAPAELEPAPAETPVLAPVPDELCPVAAERYAGDLAEGKVPALSRLKQDLRIGQKRAQTISAYLGLLTRTT